MDRKINVLINEKYGSDLAGMWTNLYSGDLFFINGLEAGKFKDRFQSRFKEKFLQSIVMDDYRPVTIPFMEWIRAVI